MVRLGRLFPESLTLYPDPAGRPTPAPGIACVGFISEGSMYILEPDQCESIYMDYEDDEWRFMNCKLPMKGTVEFGGL